MSPALLSAKLFIVSANSHFSPPESQISRFLSPPASGFFTTPSPPPPSLLLRLKTGMDSTEPSPNNISASNLHRLSCLLEDANYARLARDTVQAFEAEVEQFPWCFAGMLEGIVWERCGGQRVVLVGKDDEDVHRDAAWKLRREIGVGRTMVGLGNGKGEWVRGRNSWVKGMDLGKKTVWICEEGRCREGL